MKKHRRNWSKTEKLEIVNYSLNHGPTKASREYGVSTTSINKWVTLYESHGENGLEGRRETIENISKQELNKLRRENEQLKQIIAEKELRLRIQEDLLKKSQGPKRINK